MRHFFTGDTPDWPVVSNKDKASQGLTHYWPVAVGLAPNMPTLLTIGSQSKQSANKKQKGPLQACYGGLSLSGIKVQSTQMEEDVGLETLFVPIAKGLFDQTLDFIVEALNGTIG